VVYNRPKYIDKKCCVGAISFPSQTKNMLNGNVFNELKLGFSTQREEGRGHLHGKTYVEVARYLSAKFEMAISARSVRHYVKVLQCQDERLDIAIPRGRPREAPAAPAEPDALGAWANEILRLTGLSASSVYQKLKAAGEPAVNGIGKSSFHKRLAHQTWTPPPVERSLAADMISRCCLRIHSVGIEIETARNYWVVLAGYEQDTGFLSLALYDVMVQPSAVKAGPTSPGRPKLLPAGKPEATIFLSSDGGYRVGLSPQLLHGFYHAVCDQVGLPINRLWMSQLALSGSSAVQALRDELQGVQVDIESRSSQQYVQGKPPAGITLDALSRHLADHTARYNLAIAQSAIDALKSEIRERLLGLKKAKLKWGWGAHIDKRRRRTAAVDVWLGDYYRTHQYFDSPVRASNCRAVRVVATVTNIDD